MPIPLQEVFEIENLTDDKVHFAKWNGSHEPLDVFTRDRREWQGWQEYRTERDDFNRRYIFSLASFYHEPDTWLFGGVFEVVERLADRYVVQLSGISDAFIGRLKLRSPYKGRTVRVNMESQYEEFEVGGILPKQFAGRAFPGYEDIDLSFDEIEILVRNNRMDWRASLERVKGVYLITDSKTNKRYLGSAYGESEVWSRWCAYAAFCQAAAGRGIRLAPGDCFDAPSHFRLGFAANADKFPEALGRLGEFVECWSSARLPSA
jgi:hypothetical protein